MSFPASLASHVIRLATADGRTHFEDAPGSGKFDEQRQEAADDGADDGNLFAARAGFHFREERVGSGNEAAEVVLDRFLENVHGWQWRKRS